MQFIQNDIASDIAALTLMLSVKGPLQCPNSPDGRTGVLIPTLLSPIYLLPRNATFNHSNNCANITPPAK